MTENQSDPTKRFSTRADSYVKFRPTYPTEVCRILSQRMGLSADWVIADVGSGTGISAELFLDHGNMVYAVEPNEAMRKAAEQRLCANPRFHSVVGTAEATTLGDRSIDLVTAAQAFHWFDVDVFAREARRILKPGGWALLMWNDRQVAGTPFLESYERLLLDHGTDYLKVQHRDSPEGRAAKFQRFFGGSWELVELPNEQRFDFEGLRGRLLSSSYVPQQGDPHCAAMLAALRELYDRHQHGDRVTMKYLTQLYFAQLR